MTVDHVIPIARGGSDDPENLIAACRRCNYSKQDKLVFLAGDSTATLPRGFVSPRNESISHD
jgi:5-methylcytosine-specific restriction endonuclease McrA